MSDLINGREMLKKLHNELCYDIACNDCSMCTEDGGCRVEEWIDKFPSADRPQGEWIPSDTDGFVCSVCKNGYRNQPTLMGRPMFEYCPVCGARMKGADDE